MEAEEKGLGLRFIACRPIVTAASGPVGCRPKIDGLGISWTGRPRRVETRAAIFGLTMTLRTTFCRSGSISSASTNRKARPGITLGACCGSDEGLDGTPLAGAFAGRCVTSSSRSFRRSPTISRLGRLR